MACCQRISGKLPARIVLGIMVFAIALTSFTMRVSLSIAIIRMVKPRNHTLETGQQISECSELEGNSTLASPAEENQDEGEFEWDEVTQGLLLGAFFWGYIVSQVPGGRLAEVWGAKRVLAFSLLINSFLCCLIPVLVRWHWALLFATRVLQGIFQGVLFPCISVLIAKWIPQSERCRFYSTFSMGGTLGTAIALPICGLVISAFGWTSVFYMGGIVGVVCFASWWFLVFDSPRLHPRISKSEREYILSNLGSTVSHGKSPPMPWRAALASKEVWSALVAGVGSDWGFYTLFSVVPKYMDSILRFNLKQNAFLSALPFLSRYFFGILFGNVVDKLLQRKTLPLVVLRKISICVCEYSTYLHN